MSNTFTAQDMQNYADYVAKAALSNITPNLDRWYAEWHKPTKKVIDLSVLIESGIDCEFDDRGNTSAIAKLETITTSHTGEPYYINDKGLYWGRCTPRMNHKHAWQGGACPLPEGFEVKVWLRDDKKLPFIAKVERVTWEHRLNTVLDSIYTGYDIIAFEVLGLADGYVMPWEQDK